MVKTQFVVLAALTATAAAHPPPIDDYDREPPPPVETSDGDDASPTFNMFGFDTELGVVPLHGANTLVMSIGLGVEHPVFSRTRVFGEYDWLWLQRGAPRPVAADATVARPEDHGSGHRASLGLRRELKAKESGRARLFLDGELGTAVALVNDNMTGVTVAPSLFTGLRVGYDLYSARDSSPSRTWETALMMRAVGTRDGLGMSFGFGMFWGN